MSMLSLSLSGTVFSLSSPALTPTRQPHRPLLLDEHLDQPTPSTEAKLGGINFELFVLRQVAAHRQNSHATICAARVRSVQAIAQLPPAKRQMPSRSNRQNSPNLRSFHPIRFSPYSIRRKNCGRRTCFGLGGALCSASSASRSQVRAMSIRMVRTRKFGACSAICRHSAACSLHSTDVIIAVPRTKTRAILTRTRCFVRSISRDASHFGAHSGVRATKFRLFQPG